MSPRRDHLYDNDDSNRPHTAYVSHVRGVLNSRLEEIRPHTALSIMKGLVGIQERSEFTINRIRRKLIKNLIFPFLYAQTVT